MSHKPNWQEYGLKAGQSAEAEVVKVHDRTYGSYMCNVKHTSPQKAAMQLPNTPSPFALKG